MPGKRVPPPPITLLPNPSTHPSLSSSPLNPTIPTPTSATSAHSAASDDSKPSKRGTNGNAAYKGQEDRPRQGRLASLGFGVGLKNKGSNLSMGGGMTLGRKGKEKDRVTSGQTDTSSKNTRSKTLGRVSDISAVMGGDTSIDGERGKGKKSSKGESIGDRDMTFSTVSDGGRGMKGSTESDFVMIEDDSKPPALELSSSITASHPSHLNSLLLNNPPSTISNLFNPPPPSGAHYATPLTLPPIGFDDSAMASEDGTPSPLAGKGHEGLQMQQEQMMRERGAGQSMDITRRPSSFFPSLNTTSSNTPTAINPSSNPTPQADPFPRPPTPSGIRLPSGSILSGQNNTVGKGKAVAAGFMSGMTMGRGLKHKRSVSALPTLGGTMEKPAATAVDGGRVGEKMKIPIAMEGLKDGAAGAGADLDIIASQPPRPQSRLAKPQAASGKPGFGDGAMAGLSKLGSAMTLRSKGGKTGASPGPGRVLPKGEVEQNKPDGGMGAGVGAIAVKPPRRSSVGPGAVLQSREGDSPRRSGMATSATTKIIRRNSQKPLGESLATATTPSGIPSTTSRSSVARPKSHLPLRQAIIPAMTEDKPDTQPDPTPNLNKRRSAMLLSSSASGMPIASSSASFTGAGKERRAVRAVSMDMLRMAGSAAEVKRLVEESDALEKGEGDEERTSARNRKAALDKLSGSVSGVSAPASPQAGRSGTAGLQASTTAIAVKRASIQQGPAGGIRPPQTRITPGKPLPMTSSSSQSRIVSTSGTPRKTTTAVRPKTADGLATLGRSPGNTLASRQTPLRPLTMAQKATVLENGSPVASRAQQVTSSSRTTTAARTRKFPTHSPSKIPTPNIKRTAAVNEDAARRAASRNFTPTKPGSAGLAGGAEQAKPSLLRGNETGATRPVLQSSPLASSPGTPGTSPAYRVTSATPNRAISRLAGESPGTSSGPSSVTSKYTSRPSLLSVRSSRLRKISGASDIDFKLEQSRKSWNMSGKGGMQVVDGEADSPLTGRIGGKEIKIDGKMGMRKSDSGRSVLSNPGGDVFSDPLGEEAEERARLEEEVEELKENLAAQTKQVEEEKLKSTVELQTLQKRIAEDEVRKQLRAIVAACSSELQMIETEKARRLAGREKFGRMAGAMVEM